jgi:hypothetical protein
VTRVLLVDGYNVIHRTPPYDALAADDLDAARTALVSDVGAFAQGEWEATVVFDGGANPHSNGLAHHVAGVSVIFSAYGTEADHVIESLARTLRERGDEVLVVSSDAQTQWTVIGSGAMRMPAGEFGGELREADRSWREHTPAGERTTRLEDLIDPRVKARLSRWARGES